MLGEAEGDAEGLAWGQGAKGRATPATWQQGQGNTSTRSPSVHFSREVTNTSTKPQRATISKYEEIATDFPKFHDLIGCLKTFLIETIKEDL